MRSVIRRLFDSASAVLVSVLVMMAIGIFGLLVWQFHASWQALDHANRVSALAAADRLVYQTAGSVRAGRGIARTMLLAEDDPRATLTSIFAAADKRMEDVFRDIPPGLADDTATRLVELRIAWNRATALRDGLLAVAVKPRKERSLAETQTWFVAVGVVITDLNELSARVAGAARISDPIVGENILARQYAWAARVAAGDECGAVRSAFAENIPLNPDQRTRVTEARGRARQSMTALEELLHRAGAPVALIIARTDATNAMQVAFKKRDASYETLGTARQLDVAAWEDQCRSLLGVILSVGTVALDRMADYAARNRANALTDMAISGTVSVVASLGLVASLILVRRRIIRPVGQITAAIRRLAAHDITTGVAVYRQSDEFGAMATVLEELRHSAGEAARLVTKPATRHATGDRREAVMDRRS